MVTTATTPPPPGRYHQQVPAFGSWDCFQDVDDLSRCFEAARQAGHIRYAAADLDLYEDHVVTPTMIVVPRPMARVGMEDTDDDDDHPRKEEDKGEKSWVMTSVEDGEEVRDMRRRNPKPVDEDLYRISPQLLHSIKSNHRNKRKVMMMTKKKGLWRLFTSCLVVPCAS